MRQVHVQNADPAEGAKDGGEIYTIQRPAMHGCISSDSQIPYRLQRSQIVGRCAEAGDPEKGRPTHAFALEPFAR